MSDDEKLVTYSCVAEIDEEAASPEEAARMANDDFCNPEMTGLVFTVFGPGMATPLRIDASGRLPPLPVRSMSGSAELGPFEIEVPVPVGDRDIVLQFPNHRELIIQLRPSNADDGYNGSMDIVLDREELLTCWAGDDMQASIAPVPSRQHERYIKQIVMQLPYDPRNPKALSGPHVLESKIYHALSDYSINGPASDLIERLVAEVLKSDRRRSDAEH